MAFISYLFLIVPVCFIGIGCFLLYSAISKKGITKPDKDAPFQLYTQFRLRGLNRCRAHLFWVSDIYRVRQRVFVNMKKQQKGQVAN